MLRSFGESKRTRTTDTARPEVSQRSRRRVSLCWRRRGVPFFRSVRQEKPPPPRVADVVVVVVVTVRLLSCRINAGRDFLAAPRTIRVSGHAYVLRPVYAAASPPPTTIHSSNGDVVASVNTDALLLLLHTSTLHSVVYPRSTRTASERARYVGRTFDRRKDALASARVRKRYSASPLLSVLLPLVDEAATND